MKHLITVALLFTLSIFCTSCSENYSDGNRVGYITKFSQKGAIWKSWEGHLNMTQTGMNSADGWDFSIDNDYDNSNTIAALREALEKGQKVELTYHQVWGFKNIWNNRGETDYFVISVKKVD